MKSIESRVKILLIQPISIFSTHFDFKNTVVTHLLEIGTAVKQKFIENPKISVEVINLIDENIYKPFSISQYEKHIQSLTTFFEKFNDGTNLIFGISCFSSNYYISSLVLAKLLRKIYPTSLICVGGYQVNYFPEEFIFPRMIEGGRYSEKLFDYVFLGESDFKFAEILEDRILRNKIHSQKYKFSQIIQCDLVQNLESLPLIDYSLMKFPESPFLFVPIYFSKGCPFKCAFCGDFRNKYDPKQRWRRTNPKDAYSRLNNLLKYYEKKYVQVQICDPIWAYPGWRIKFYEILTENEISEEIWAEIRVDQYSTTETPFIKKLNFTIAFGLESADPDMLRIMKKTTNPTFYLKRFKSVLSELDNVGIYVIANLIFGHPGENIDSVSHTMEYIESILEPVQNFLPSVGKYMLYPGSEIYTNQNYYFETYKSKFYYPHYWSIPKCSAIASSMVDPSYQLTYLDVIKIMSDWIPTLYTKCIKKFSKKNDRDFIYQRYLNQMIFGPRMYWKKNVLEEYNEFGNSQDVLQECNLFWNDLF